MGGCLYVIGIFVLTYMLITALYMWLGGWGLAATILLWFLLSSFDGR